MFFHQIRFSNKSGAPIIRSNKSGMTLAETLIAISIFIVIMVVVGTFEVNVFSYQKYAAGSLETAQDAQALLKVITKEIRSMAPSGNGAYHLVVASTSTISFFSDANGDGVVEQITYTLLNKVLYRAVIIPSGSPAVYNPATQSTTTLVMNVRNDASLPTFQYFDENYDGTTQPLAQPVSLPVVRSIKVSLTLDVDPNRSPLPITYAAVIQLRNLKTNL